MTDRRRHMDHRQEQARARAVQLLQHYIGLLMKRTAGGGDSPATSDTMAELEAFVDDLIEAATPGKTAHEQAVERDRQVEIAKHANEPDPRD